MTTLGLRDLGFLAAGQGGGAALWTPAQIATALWLDADDASTITTVSGNVSQWNDKSGNGKNVTQSTSGNRPAYEATGFNSLPVLSFDGTSDYLENSSSGITSGTYTGSLTVFYVATKSAGSGGTILTERSSATVGSFSCFDQSGRYYISSDGFDPASNHDISLSDFNLITSSGSVVVHVHAAGSRDQLWINGNSITVLNGTASSIAGGAGFRIGRREGNVGNFWPGKIRKIIALASTPSTALRQQMEGYLAWDSGLQSSLPAGHPYKSSAPTV